MDGRAATHVRSAAAHRVSATDADAVLAACRLLVALSAQSIAAAEKITDRAEARALAIVASAEPISLSAFARAAQLHPSTASRLCDRLVRTGLLTRTDDPDNRRALLLRTTNKGRRVISSIADQRRTAITPLLQRMSATRRHQLVAALNELAAFGGEPSEHDLWAMGWATR